MKPSLTLLILLASIGVPVSSPAASPCDAGAETTMRGAEGAPWVIQLELDPDEIPLNAPFGAGVHVCSSTGQPPARLTLDATMPAHKHGMNYEPSLVRLDDVRYEVRNLLFHMPGIWRFEVTAYEDRMPHRYTLDVSVP